MYGWIVDIPFLKSPVPGLATMKVNTACGFIAASAALWLVHICAPDSPWLRVARCVAGMVAGVGALTLAEDLFALDFGIDQLLWPDDLQPAATAHPGRMSPATSFSFFFFGLAVLTLKARRAWIANCTHWLVVPSLVVAMLAILGYSYSVSSLQNIGVYTSMAVHTAVSFFALSLFVLAADLNHGFAKIATSDTAGGVVSRRLLPTIPITLFLLSLLRLKGEVDGYYNFQFGLAVMVGMSITVSVVAVAWIATTLHATDVKRQAFEAEIISLNADLEMRVQQRTKELEQVSIKLSSANNALERLSLEDALTGIGNRRSFDTDLAIYMAIADRHMRPVALVLYDVDAFKAFNDHYGHPAGDECLKRIAAALLSCCRRPNDVVARYGGEEFAMILPDTDLQGAIRIAESARDAVSALEIPHAFSPAGAHVSISGGIAILVGTHKLTAEELTKMADQYLYEAKRQGRNRLVYESKAA